MCVETEQGTVPVRAMLLWGRGERVERYVLRLDEVILQEFERSRSKRVAADFDAV